MEFQNLHWIVCLFLQVMLVHFLEAKLDGFLNLRLFLLLGVGQEVFL